MASAMNLRENLLHVHAQGDAALGQGKRQKLIADAMLSLYSDRRTCQASIATASHEAPSQDEGRAGDRTIISQIDEAESHQPNFQDSPGGIERRGFLCLRDPYWIRAFLDTLSHQRRAAGEDRGKGEKVGPPMTGRRRACRKACDDGHRPPRPNPMRCSYQRV